MSAGILPTVGDKAKIGFANSFTLTQGTITSGTLTAGILGGNLTANQTLSNLALIYDIKAADRAPKKVELTKLDSTAEESQPGTIMEGEITATLQYTAAAFSTLNTLVNNGIPLAWGLALNDYTTGSTDTILAWISKLSVGDLKKDEPTKITLTLQLTGTSTFTQGT